MDPLSATSGAMSMSANAISMAKTLYDLRGKYRAADYIIEALYSETTIIANSLVQIQTSILANTSSVTNPTAKTSVYTTLNTALKDCGTVFDLLNEEVFRLEKYEKDRKNGRRLKIFEKVKVVWNETLMQDSLRGMNGVKASLCFILQMLSDDKLSSVVRKVDATMAVLAEIDRRTRDQPRFEEQDMAHTNSISFLDLNDYDDDTDSGYHSIAHSDVGDEDQNIEELGVLGHVTTHEPEASRPRVDSGFAPEESLAAFLSGNTWYSSEHSPGIRDLSPPPSNDSDPRVLHQTVFDEFVKSEKGYLNQLLTLRYLYKNRFLLWTGIPGNQVSHPLADGLPGAEEIFSVNKDHLLEPLSALLDGAGSHLDSIIGVFEKWLKVASDLYLVYAKTFAHLRDYVCQEASKNGDFEDFLWVGMNHTANKEKHTLQLLLMAPVTRLQQYHFLLRTLFTTMDLDGSTDSYLRLDALIDALNEVLKRYDAAAIENIRATRIECLNRVIDTPNGKVPESARILCAEEAKLKVKRRNRCMPVTIVVYDDVGLRMAIFAREKDRLFFLYTIPEDLVKINGREGDGTLSFKFEASPVIRLQMSDSAVERCMIALKAFTARNHVDFELIMD